MKRILILMTNHNKLGETDEDNGTYIGELTHAVSEFMKAGFDFDLASIKGGKVPLYGLDEFDDESHKTVMADESFTEKLQNTLKADELKVDEYDAIFYPGGFGLLSDLAENEAVSKITAEHYESGGVVGAVCHGPAGLLPVKLSNGDFLLADKKVTGFTRDEESAAGTIDNVPFLLEERLLDTAAKFVKVAEWQEHVVVDGRVITGQNPASAHGVGKAMVSALS